MGRWSRRLAPLLATFASVDARDSVLDVGSGTGALASVIAQTYLSVRVTGVDPAAAYLTAAQARAPRDRVRFAVGAAQALPIRTAAVDKTLSMLVLNFIPDRVKALDEMMRVTRAGGLEQVEELPMAVELSFASFDDYWLPFLGGQGPAGAYVASSGSARSCRARIQASPAAAGHAQGRGLRASGSRVGGQGPGARLTRTRAGARFHLHIC